MAGLAAVGKGVQENRMQYQGYTEQILERLNQVILGKERQIRLLFSALLSGGHVLLEDVPGVGKTTLAKAFAGVLDLSFGRIQFTPDTLPSDVTGVAVYHMNTGEFVYREGPVMNQLVLADEINRTSPKTQSSLLEAMAEGQVSVDGVIHPLPEPFMVIATQNPIDFLGTYQLPEAQLDRFFMKLSLGYPDREYELLMAERYLEGDYESADRGGKVPEPLADAELIGRMKAECASLYVHPELTGYIVSVTEATRRDEGFSLGASPRATLALLRASQAAAYLDGRSYVLPDDIQSVIFPVLCHRMLLSADARMKKLTGEKVLKEILLRTPVPVLNREALCGKTV